MNKLESNKQASKKQTIHWGKQKEISCLIMNIKKHKDFFKCLLKVEGLVGLYVCKESLPYFIVDFWFVYFGFEISYQKPREKKEGKKSLCY